MRIAFTILLLTLTTTLHAQNMLGRRLKDATMILGTEYNRVQDGPVTKLRYEAKTVDHPTIGMVTEYDQYDFLDEVCEARHTYIPLAYKQRFIEYLNKTFGWNDHLWRGDNDTYITIKTRDDDFELMVWTPTYEKMLDNR